MTEPDLATHFARLTDEALAERLASGELTDEACALAATELQSRGLPVPQAAMRDGPPAEEALGDMVILERGLMPTEAYLLCNCLQSAGIPADAGDVQIVQTHSLLAIAVGGASVRVRSKQLAEAREVLSAFRRGDFALDDDFDVDQPASGAT